MFKRSAAAIPAGATSGTAAALFCARMALDIARWTSSSVGIVHRPCGIEVALCPCGFFGEHRKRRDVVVPFDQGRLGSELFQRLDVQIPDSIAHARAV